MEAPTAAASTDGAVASVRYYFYALRDQLPLGDDWFIAANELRPGLGLREYRCGFLKRHRHRSQPGRRRPHAGR